MLLLLPDLILTLKSDQYWKNRVLIPSNFSLSSLLLFNKHSQLLLQMISEIIPPKSKQLSKEPHKHSKLLSRILLLKLNNNSQGLNRELRASSKIPQEQLTISPDCSLISKMKLSLRAQPPLMDSS